MNTFARDSKRVLIAAALALLMQTDLPTISNASAQSPTATLNGTVVDDNGALVPDVNILLVNSDTTFERQAFTNREGYFSITLLPPGRYVLKARRDGFATAEIKEIKLSVGDQVAVSVKLKVGSISESIIIEGSSVIQTESAAVGTLVDRRFVENLPLNGRSFHALLELTPGVVLTKSSYAEQGQFSVNGQRDNDNYFMVDGVSANIGIAGGLSLGQTAGGTVPAFSALGTTSNLVSVDALEEFRIQTSTYAPEFGRSPGAQVSLLTRSGTNRFHATLFNYFRNEALDANDWFANSRGLDKPAHRQKDFGGVVGGPIIKDKTFFFFSYEGLRLRLPQVGITQVPSASTRQSALPQMQPFLNAFPKSNSRELQGGLAEFSASYSDPSSLDATSIRIDQTIASSITIFGRYNDAPSETVFRDPDLSLNNLGLNPFKTQTLTLGLTQAITSTISNDFRFNYSRARAGTRFALDQFGGAIPPPDAVVFPSFTDSRKAFFQFAMPGAAYLVGKNADNLQRQVNVVDGLSVLAGVHQLKFGIDYRRLSPVSDISEYSMTVVFFDLSEVIAGISPFVDIGATNGRAFPLFTNLSAYAQDAWKASRRLTLTYGSRWDYNPPPREKNGNDPLTVVGLDNPATMTLAPKGTPLWRASYKNFAPRLGIAYQLSQAKGFETVLRGGIGLFYGLGTGLAGRAVSAGHFSFSAGKSLSGVRFPLTTEEAAPPAFSLSPPYPNIFVLDSNLKLPKTYEWNISIEQSLNSHQSVSISYVGALGRDLLRFEVLAGPNLPNPNFRRLVVGRNAATSDYHALQTKYHRRLSRSLQALAAYTWSHSIDSASTETAFNLPAAKINPNLNRGASDFDVRHSFSGALTYDIPAPVFGSLVNSLLRDWSIDAMFRARSATPLNVIISRPLFNVPTISRPDRVPGAPLYINDRAVAGGRRINRAAFSVPPLNQQGNLGRNSLRGFSASQLDMSLRRKLNLMERLSLQLRADFFNVLNHPNFADPNGSFSNINFFGQSLQMLGQSLADGAGLNPLYQIGGPRSIQLALKLQF
ncbi:MAG TPA: TonB-dependent receptor [Blastocatellia bacterium]|nr:TonB-dependent receptor [Blastocatellia bacterium]